MQRTVKGIICPSFLGGKDSGITFVKRHESPLSLQREGYNPQWEEVG